MFSTRVVSASCHCKPLTEAECQPGAVITVCGIECMKMAEFHLLFNANVTIVRRRRRRWWRFW